MLADAFARIVHTEGEPRIVVAACEHNVAVVRGVLECVRHQIEEHPLYLFDVDGKGEVAGNVQVELQFYVARAGKREERFGPFTHQRCDVGFLSVNLQFTVFVFSEIENLIDETLENAYVFVGKTHESVLLGSEVGSGKQLLHRLGNESERGAQVVRHVGEEHQLRLCGSFQLCVEFLLHIALLLKQFVLVQKFALVAFSLPESVQQQKQHARHKNKQR